MTWQDPDAVKEAARYASPIPSRKLILQTLEQSPVPMTAEGFIMAFNLEEADQVIAIKRRLNAMVRDFELMLTGDFPDRYRAVTESDTFEGSVQANIKGFGFVLLDDSPDLMLNEREMTQVFHGDVVRAVVAGSDSRGRLLGKIVEIIKRKQTNIIGKVTLLPEGYFVQPAHPNTHQPIALEPEQVAHSGLKVGDFVRIAIDEFPTKDDYANGHVIENLAEFSDTELIIPTALLDFDIPHVFDEDVLREAANYREPTENDCQGRIDLRALPLVTIDGEDARDFDDAVYASHLPNGGYRLVVAIADVSHYVKLDTALDIEAQARGTSVYFPNHVVPMLPEALSNGLCSLNPHKDRLCMVCDMQLSASCEVTSYTFYPSVMHSQARLTYNVVSDFLNGADDTSGSSMSGEDWATRCAAIINNANVTSSIVCLNEIYHKLLETRKTRGALEFETTETYMTFDDRGAITNILPRSRNDAHRLIEECMLLANVSAADYALKNDLPVLYRNHEPPEASRAQKVQSYLKLLGLSFPEKPSQQDYQRIIEATMDRVDVDSIHAVLLRSMMQAVYCPSNVGHFGLAFDAYTHFTSPIRRYPDLLLHRAIKTHLKGKLSQLSGAALVTAGEHYSQTERRADEASRSVTAWLKCQYMQQHLGEEFDGMITAVTEFGLFVTLTDLYVEGLVHVRNMGHDYYEYDVARQALIGRSNNQTFALGDKVRISVAGVSLEDRKIDFALVRLLSNKQPSNPIQPNRASTSKVASNKITAKALAGGQSTNNKQGKQQASSNGDVAQAETTQSKRRAPRAGAVTPKRKKDVADITQPKTRKPRNQESVTAQTDDSPVGIAKAKPAKAKPTRAKAATESTVAAETTAPIPAKKKRKSNAKPTVIEDSI